MLSLMLSLVVSLKLFIGNIVNGLLFGFFVVFK